MEGCRMRSYVIMFCIIAGSQLEPCFAHPSAMAKKTVLNEAYQGLLVAMTIPAEVHDHDGKVFASFGSAVPIHRCTKEQVSEYSKTTHHYCGIFTEQLLAPLADIAYVRIDENTAEKVFINRTKRILLKSSDGHLAQWRAVPTFESSNRFVAGAPLVSAAGELLSLVTARRGNHYAVTNIDGVGGYFETSAPWKEVIVTEGRLIYGDRTFSSREALREYIGSLPPGAASLPGVGIAFTPTLHIAPTPRITLVDASTGRQIAHYMLDGVIVKDIEYL